MTQDDLIIVRRLLNVSSHRSSSVPSHYTPAGKSGLLAGLLPPFECADHRKTGVISVVTGNVSIPEEC